MKTPWTFEQPLCAEIGTSAYFPLADDTSDREIVHPENWRLAKKLCSACKHKEECLEWAIETNEAHGIWGGMSVVERRAYKRKNTRSKKAC
jgi:WhiB family redox-sensing transcriptional regulator